MSLLMLNILLMFGSRIFDYVGQTVSEIKDQREGFMSYDIDFEDMYEYRNSCTILKDIRSCYEVVKLWETL